ncbi:MAG: hypothetical protein A3J66_01130 [Candidatus Magasanikbacteria bacterium RIFCSPHIGHO2_02_FULL_47_14]|uniref:CR-type domain-containing protein n=1 Tax=Candidatus Magasanikbacteria bacterium RIFCSPHIGHO2_02_FULL_47_14 TaxID=1798680 RepID=A0A1F6MAE1_9BACT|nr:MAG: hypothetical protein A3J66_01130 [Candidatus Magasanikbacteria bacterium RIFCSPHIGHO2_02_FULL_47_14]
MRHILKSIGVIIFGIFFNFHFVFAQGTNLNQQQIYQNQPPVSRPVNTDVPEEPRVTSEQAEPQAIAPAVLPQESSPKSSLFYLLYGVPIVLAFLGLEEWLRKWRKKKKKPELPAEAEKIVCPTCGGSGKITKKRRKTVPCGHCKATGIDICHHCSGTGRDGLGYGVPLEDIENYPKCLYCSGKGVPELFIACCMCKGKRKEEFDEPYEVPCPTCKGSGWVRNW